MNNRGQEEIIAIATFAVIFIVIIIILVFLFSSITINILVFELKNGQIGKGVLEESSISRLSSWFGDKEGSGFYDVEIRSDSELIKMEKNSGAGIQLYYIKQFVECVEITILNSDTKKELDNEEVCKK